MLASLIFIFNRILQLLTLIPTLGMLAYFVDGYNKRHALTPSYILVLFIISVLAAVWALVTLVRRESTRRSALFVAFVDACFLGAFIAGAYELRGIASANCVNVTGGVDTSGGVSTGPDSITLSPLSINYTPWSISANKSCAMLKASFAFAIMNCVFFATTAVMALFLHRHERVYVKETVYRSRSHGSRRGHSSHSGHRRRSSSRGRYYV